MKIYVDADACPVKQTIAEESLRFRVKSVFVCSFANHFHMSGEWMETIIVDKSFQSADIYIVNHAGTGDLVVTDDYGLAGLVLGKGCLAISFRGKEYSDDNIDQLLMTRHQASKERLAGRRTKGPKPMNRQQVERFQTTLRNCLQVQAGNC